MVGAELRPAIKVRATGPTTALALVWETSVRVSDESDPSP